MLDEPIRRQRVIDSAHRYNAKCKEIMQEYIDFPGSAWSFSLLLFLIF